MSAYARALPEEEIARRHPEIDTLNIRDSELLNAMSVAERRILLESSKNPIGVAAIQEARARAPAGGAGAVGRGEVGAVGAGEEPRLASLGGARAEAGSLHSFRAPT